MTNSSVLRLGMMLASAFAPAIVWGAPPVSYNRDVRPLLAAKCFACHGPDEASRAAELRLDTSADATADRMGTPAIRPGQPEASELVRRILSRDPDEMMPPPDSHKVLTEPQKQLLQTWIQEGAKYEQHWAFVPPAPPSVPSSNRPEWTRNAIDRFIASHLDAAGLSPSPEADRATLIRRLSLDLIGLPPTPSEADAFIHDPAPDAYERLVDRLLASPHYGERWARRWLDLARYADTNGYEKDRPRNMWPYRDWVIRALNDDMPFSQFTVEQLAGDMLPHPSREQLIATGFHRNTMLNEEGGIDPLEFRFHAMTDRVATTGTTWLALTLGCAQCHTHKYDPLKHTEYFGIMAYLNNADEPEIDLPDANGAAAKAERAAKADALLRDLPRQWPVVDPPVWTTPAPENVATESGQPARILDDRSVLLAEANPASEVITVELQTPASADHLRLEALLDEALPHHGPGRGPDGGFSLSELRVESAPLSALKENAPPLDWKPVSIGSAIADTSPAEAPIALAFDGKDSTAWTVPSSKAAQTATFRFDKSYGFPEGTRWRVRLIHQGMPGGTMGRLRVSLGALPSRTASELEQVRSERLEAAFERWLTEARQQTVNWDVLVPVSATSNLPLLTGLPDGSVLASGDITKDDTYDIQFERVPAGVTAIRLEALPHDSLPGHGPGLAYYEGPKGDFYLGEFQARQDGQLVPIASATESYAKNHFGALTTSAKLTLDGNPQSGWTCAGRPGERHSAVYVLATPTTAAGDLNVKLRFGRHFASSLGHFRLSVTTHPGGAIARDLSLDTEALLRKPNEQLTAEERTQLRDVFLLSASEVAKQSKEIRDLRRPATELTALVLRERPDGQARPTHRHERGEYMQPKEPVAPTIPAVLRTDERSIPADRREFAEWLVSSENPLTARVTVNRHWAYLFGQGLVRSTGDFGVQGEAPTHPELLDWLALDLVDRGWSIKSLHRLIVTSATYRQASQVTPALLASDPQNRLLARGPRIRVEGEIVRDVALRISGLLSEKMYGPPVHPPQPPGVTDVAYGKNEWKVSEGEDRYRRGLFTFQKRTAPFAMFSLFDGPTGEQCIAQREVSNTPLQALTLLNDPVMVEAADRLGTEVAGRSGSDAERIHDLFRRCLTRLPTADESERLRAFVTAQRGRAESAKDAEAAKDKVEERLWASVARALLNLDETMTRN